MVITVDEAQPEDSINRYAMDTHCTGEEPLEIPPHWHMVSAHIIHALRQEWPPAHFGATCRIIASISA